MASLRSDSLLVKRIVRSFLRFLDSVELAPNVDAEAIIVANQCLTDSFQVQGSSSNEAEPDLISLFRQAGYDATMEVAEDTAKDYAPQPSTTSSEAIHDKISDNNGIMDFSEENLFEQFKDALMNAGYFDELTTPYTDPLEKAKIAFKGVLKKARGKGDAADQHILAEAFKAQGNDAMASSQFVEAIGLYTMAIKMSSENAVYYSNRAAAYTQVGKYEEAIADSNEAIRIDPNYSKAYSRLGLAYYTQGKYKEAIELGFQIAHSLDPNNRSILENLQAAQKKMNEERSRSGHPNEEHRQQNSNTTSQGSDARFSTNIPLNIPMPEGMANFLPSVANLAAHFVGGHVNERGNGNAGVDNEGYNPDIMMDGNMNVTVELGGDPAFAGMMQSMLQMLARSNGQVNAEGQNHPPQGN